MSTFGPGVQPRASSEDGGSYHITYRISAGLKSRPPSVSDMIRSFRATWSLNPTSRCRRSRTMGLSSSSFLSPPGVRDEPLALPPRHMVAHSVHVLRTTKY
ncbi:hypothetical protein MPTK1_7g05070 [Marchantia polymorpha subsp. ruderalis]|uniref:Uncharacterized protein n=2 Tax=Marchantia polymorpha TaxID=3197 RepID=A0AAF6BWA5_MARPO|nr:hypothetical protein MARPO_0062s0019 [Marchantia polymorpha]BBN16289.1 hypothetical protein Mp_7g05070 [Marchantia polymorpha subsp. ruderalis]|eukprot:PTQ36593.1 hypothetical protein MARPO_0062s0019 [Marchantia polymorpha]